MPTIAKVRSARNIKASIRYARDSKDEQGHPKVHDKIGINCNPEQAENDFESTNFVNKWSNRSHVQLKKFVLGFGPLNKNTLSAQEAHIYVKRLLNKYNNILGGGWRIAAYSHHDRPQSYHYHILVDNCNIKTGQKLTSTYNDVTVLRNLNDIVSRDFGIQPVQKQRLVVKDMKECKGQEKAQKNNKPRYAFQDHVRVLLSKAMLKAKNFDEFKQVLKNNHADVKSNFINKKSKTGTIIIPSIQPNGNYNHDKNGNHTKRKVRTGKLGLAFDKKNIMKQLSKPINERNTKYMSIYKKYNKTPNSVILTHLNPTPFTNNNKEKTSREYLNSNIIRDRFKTKEEISRERQFKLVRTIKSLNKKFSAEESGPQKSKQSASRQNSRSNSTERALKRASDSLQKPVRPINNKSDEAAVRRAKRAIERAKQSTKATSSSKRRKPSIKSTNSPIKQPTSRQNSNQSRKQQSFRYQRSVTFSNQHIRITKENQDQYSNQDRVFLSKGDQQATKQQNQQSKPNFELLRRCRKALKTAEKISWAKLHKQLAQLKKYADSIDEAVKEVRELVRDVTRYSFKRFSSHKISIFNNKYSRRYSKHSKSNKNVLSIDNNPNYNLKFLQYYNAHHLTPKLIQSKSKESELTLKQINVNAKNHEVFNAHIHNQNKIHKMHPKPKHKQIQRQQIQRQQIQRRNNHMHLS